MHPSTPCTGSATMGALRDIMETPEMVASSSPATAPNLILAHAPENAPRASTSGLRAWLRPLMKRRSTAPAVSVLAAVPESNTHASAGTDPNISSRGASPDAPHTSSASISSPRISNSSGKADRRRTSSVSRLFSAVSRRISSATGSLGAHLAGVGSSGGLDFRLEFDDEDLSLVPGKGTCQCWLLGFPLSDPGSNSLMLCIQTHARATPLALRANSGDYAFTRCCVGSLRAHRQYFRVRFCHAWWPVPDAAAFVFLACREQSCFSNVA